MYDVPDHDENDQVPTALGRGPLIVKALATATLVTCAAVVAGFGTFGTFTSSTSSTEQVTTGTVGIDVGGPGTAANRLSVGATGFAAGDTTERAVDLINNGDLDLSAITLDSIASPSTLLDTDPVDGLQMTLDSCSVAWTEIGAGLGYTYTCSGIRSVHASSLPVTQSGLVLTGLATQTAGATDHLRVTLRLPNTANNRFQGLMSQINYTFTAVQRNGMSK